APSVRDGCLQAAPEATIELQLQRLIVRGRAICDQADEREIRIRIKDCLRAQEPSAARADVSERERLRRTERALRRQVPLQCVRQLQLWIKSDEWHRHGRCQIERWKRRRQRTRERRVEERLTGEER